MIRRGEVYWFGPDPVMGSEQSGRRPAVVVSRDAINRSSPVLVIVPVTTHRSQLLYPSDVLVRAPEGGLEADSVLLGLQIRAVDKRRLGVRMGILRSSTVEKLERALLTVLDIQI